MICHRLPLGPVIQTYTPTTLILTPLRVANFTAKEKTSDYEPTASRLESGIEWPAGVGQ